MNTVSSALPRVKGYSSLLLLIPARRIVALRTQERNDLLSSEIKRQRSKSDDLRGSEGI